MIDTILRLSGAVLWIVIGVYVIPQIPATALAMVFYPCNWLVEWGDERYEDPGEKKWIVFAANRGMQAEQWMSRYYNWLLKTPYTKLPLF